MMKLNGIFNPAFTLSRAQFSQRLMTGPLPGTHCFAANDDEFIDGGGAPSAPKTPDAPQSITARKPGNEQTISREQIRDLLANNNIEEVIAHGADAVEQLIALLKDEDRRVCWGAAHAVGRIGDPRAVEPLMPLLKDKSIYVRGNAAIALGEIEDPRAVEPLILLLKDKSIYVRKGAVKALGVIKDPHAVEPLIALLKDGSSDLDLRWMAAWALGEIKDSRAIVPLVELLGDVDVTERLRTRASEALKELGDSESIDKSFLAHLRSRSDLNEDAIELYKEIAEELDLYDSLVFLQGNERLRETIREKIEEIIETIKGHLAETLGLSDYLTASTSEGNGTYGSVSMGQGMRLELKQEQRLELLPGDFLEIDEGTSIEEAIEVVRTLNFLVHHEMGHVIYEQQKQRVHEPKVRASQFRHIDLEAAAHNANEMVIDKIGFDAARNIYVHGDGDITFDHDTREIIAIQAYRTLAQRVLRHHTDGSNAMPIEDLARIRAVLLEIAERDVVAAKTKDQLKDLAARYLSELSSNTSPDVIAELNKLVAMYRTIFRKTKLDVPGK